MMRRSVRSIALFGFGVVLALSACGGGGSDTAPAAPPPCSAAGVCYVRDALGKDTNTGEDAAHALKTILKAAQIARSGYTIIVGPGIYTQEVNTARPGKAPQGLMFIADTLGTQTGGTRGPVVVNVTDVAGAAGFNLSNSPGSVIDGFTIIGALDSGIVIKSGSDNFTIRNCLVHDNPGNGIVVQDSDSVLVFNNLVYSNGKFGINIAGPTSGSPNARVINNTIYDNGIRGITVGTSQVASPAPFIRNNIIQNNKGDGNFKIFTPPPNDIPRSDVNYQGDYNLVFPDNSYLPDAIRRPHDVNMNAQFFNANTGDFHLLSSSPAINAGNSLNNFPDLRDFLRTRTTTGAGSPDSGLLDIGFHYPS